MDEVSRPDQKNIQTGLIRKNLSTNKLRSLLILVLWAVAPFARIVDFNFLVLIVIFLYIFITCKYNIRFVLRYVSSFSGAILVWVSIFIIEVRQLWLSELGTYGHYSGVMPMCASYYILFLLCLEIFDERCSKIGLKARRKIKFSLNGSDATKIVSQFATIAVIGVTAILFLHVLNKPAFRYNMDRFDYRAVYLGGIWGTLSNYLVYFIPLILVNWKNGKKTESVFAIGLYVFYLFWTGERFTGFLSVIFYLSMFLADYKDEKKTKVKLQIKHILIMTVVLALILAVVIGQYSRLYSVNAWQHLLERISQQGQLWWAIFDKYSREPIHIRTIGDELQAIKNPNGIPKYYGIYKIMYLCAPANIVTAKIQRGQNYTESTAASIFYYFGPVVLMLFAVLFAFVLANMMRYYYNSIMENRIVSAVIMARLLMVYRNVSSMSRFHMAIGTGTILLTLMLLLIRGVQSRTRIKVWGI